jgi:hypothetical protein
MANGLELVRRFVGRRRRWFYAADAKAAAPSVTEMEARLLGSVELGPDVIRALEQKRAEVARDRILHAAEVDPSRLFLVQGSEQAKKEGGAKVHFTLK